MRRLLILQAVSYFGAFAVCELASTFVWHSLDGFAQRAAAACALGAVILSATAALDLIARRAGRPIALPWPTAPLRPGRQPRPAPVETRVPRPSSMLPECWGLTVCTRCPLCAGWTNSTVLEISDDDVVEIFVCEHCQALLASENAGHGRSASDAEIDRIRRDYPATWRCIEQGQRAWRAKQRGLSSFIPHLSSEEP
jgi:hypothetical protein